MFTAVAVYAQQIFLSVTENKLQKLTYPLSYFSYNLFRIRFVSVEFVGQTCLVLSYNKQPNDNMHIA